MATLNIIDLCNICWETSTAVKSDLTDIVFDHHNKAGVAMHN
jgi:hypothetical protein